MNKVALITGATGGIGSAIASNLKGYDLSLLSRTIMDRESPHILYQRCDITEEDSVWESVVNTIGKFGRIDALVNCAGISGYSKIEDVDFDTAEIYNVNVAGTINMCKVVLPHMKAQGSGCIVNIGSLRGIQCGTGKAAYSMSKAAVIAFSKTLKEEVKEYGINVYVVNPGFVDIASYNKGQLKRITASPYKDLKIDKEDMLQPEDIAQTVAYLIESSPDISEINMGRLWQ